MRRKHALGLLVLLALVVGAGLAVSRLREPGADADFIPFVETAALQAQTPRVVFDHGHLNSHSISGRYRPFAKLLRADGCRVRQTGGRIDARLLDQTDVLVVVNASGPEPDRTAAAFDPGECDAIEAWVRGGGALLLVADHHPYGESAASLAARFGVEMSGGWTDDSTHARAGSGDPGQVVFTRAVGTLGDHPITNGEGVIGGVDTVETFTGQSLRGPADAAALLLLSQDAMDRLPVSARVETQGSKRISTFETQDRSAAGRTQGLALRHGAGRVVVLADGAMLTAQKERTVRFGMNSPGNHNRLFTLNVVRWLAGALEPRGADTLPRSAPAQGSSASAASSSASAIGSTSVR
jgi:hypothetical protein